MSRLFPNRNSTRHYLKLHLQEIAARVPAGSTVLDAGAGHCPYRDLFHHTQYETADFCQVDKKYGQIDYVCDLSQIPVETASRDVVICTQVLEHLAEPDSVLRELARILKPEGTLILSAPLYYEEHEQPYDFFRYTQFGLRHLLQKAGLEATEMFWLEGYCGSLAHQTKRAGHYLPKSPRNYGGGALGIFAAASSAILRPVFAILSRWFAFLDRQHRFTGRGHCMNYFLTARKIAAASQASKVA